MKRLRGLLAMLVCCGLVSAQVPQPVTIGQQSPGGQQPGVGQQEPAGQGSQIQAPPLRPNYVLRSGDQVLIRAFEMEEISDRPFRIDDNGMIDLPILGKVQAGGVSVDNLTATLTDLSKKYVREPQISITVTQYSSDLVFFVGAFKAPGIYPLTGGQTLEEKMAAIGGLLPTASRRIKVTRRKEYGAIPLPNVITLPDGSGTSVEINIASLSNNVNPAEDIVLKPFDVIGVERAELIYVAGEVGHGGAFELQERDSMSVIQVLTLAGGLAPTADKNSIRILRPVANTSLRAEIPLHYDEIMRGEANDTPLLPNDVLYVGKSHRIQARDLIYVLPIVGLVTSLVTLIVR